MRLVASRASWGSRGTSCGELPRTTDVWTASGLPGEPDWQLDPAYWQLNSAQWQLDPAGWQLNGQGRAWEIASFSSGESCCSQVQPEMFLA